MNMIDPEIPSVIGLVDWTALAVGVIVILAAFTLYHHFICIKWK